MVGRRVARRFERVVLGTVMSTIAFILERRILIAIRARASSRYSLPATIVSLRNLAIGILRAHGDRNIATALRRNARDATRPLAFLGITSP